MTRPAPIHRLLAASLITAAALGACGGPPPVEKPDLERVYEGLVDPFPRVTPSTLAGFRILIDPGHGGSFRGTVGQDSLEESKVNLGVSLYLWGLLREAGAEVYLTRSSDRDFLTDADSALAFDLQKRVDAVDSLQPDLFVSIHHNAQPARDPAYNRIETYYNAGDPASLDLAFAIHRHLIRNLGISVGEVRQGNYYVLRNVTVPAVLGESSYLTHPPVEDKLRLSRAQELEAEAYFLGIVDYCRRGVPRVAAVSPVESLLTEVPTVACTFQDHGGLGIDPDGVSLSINGEAVGAHLSASGTRASYELPWDAPNGAYAVAVSARNLGGNTSPVARTRFVLSQPPAMAAITTEPRTVPGSGGVVRVRARVLDRRGLPVADGTQVSLTSSLARNGGALRDSVSGGSVEFALRMPAGVTRDVALTLACAGRTFEARVPAGSKDATAWRSLAISDALTGSPVANAGVYAGDSTLATGSPSGVYGFAAAQAATVRAPGYRPVPVPVSGDTLRLEPWFGGALLGRRFVIDPQGGTPQKTGVGAMGLSGAHVNLRVAIYLQAFLRAAGADVLLTRTSEEVRLPEDIARLTNRYRADRYLEIRHPAAPAESALSVGTYYFPGSAKGETMAREVGEAFASALSVPFRGASATVTYALQQTACPAIVVAAPSIANVDEELRLDSSAYLRKQAYGIFAGILRHFGAAGGGRLEVGITGANPSGWMVTLDDTWTLVTGPDGVAAFDAVPAGEHHIAYRRGDDIGEQTIATSAGDARIMVETGH
jgi:N-acetylmuramoyl-L-alanine amidase